LTYVRDFSVVDRANGAGGYCDDRESVPDETGEFHFISRAFVMNQNDGPDIARLQSVLGEVSRQHNGAEF
jgi:hypothetical protein